MRNYIDLGPDWSMPSDWKVMHVFLIIVSTVTMAEEEDTRKIVPMKETRAQKSLNPSCKESVR